MRSVGYGRRRADGAPPTRALDVESVRAVFPQWLADTDRRVDQHYNTDAVLTDVVLALAALVQQ